MRCETYHVGLLWPAMTGGVGRLFAIAVLQMVPLLNAADYWVAVGGDDRHDGQSPEQAWASPSRGQPTRIREPYQSGQRTLAVDSTDGFLDVGTVIVNGQSRAYDRKTKGTIQLNRPFGFDATIGTRVLDGTVLDGRSFAPGDVIHLVGGAFVDRSLRVEQSGRVGHPVTYRCAPGQRAVLLPERFDQAGIRVGFSGGPRTEHVALVGLAVRNRHDGNHGAPGIDLVGTSHVEVRDCDIEISGRDINGDNNAIRLVDAERVRLQGCRLRSQYANGVAAWGTREVEIERTLVYESFQGIVAGGGRYRSDLTIRNCTVYATNQHGGINAEAPSRVTVDDSLIVQIPSLTEAALAGTGSGDHNCLWHTARRYDDEWNATGSPGAGEHDLYKDPQFLSLDPRSPRFLRFTTDSPAATAGRGGAHVGAFAPVTARSLPSAPQVDVVDFGARGDGVQDDTEAVLKALAAVAPGGTLLFPPTDHHYLIGRTIELDRSDLRVAGAGATLKLQPGVGRIHLIAIGGAGPTRSIVENVVVEGLTLDANYHSQPQQRAGGIPRGIWVEHAHRVKIKDVTIRDCFCGLSFSRHTRSASAINVTVTDWDHDAFGASGWGGNGSCTDIRFAGCRAIDTSRCVKAWEIEEGAQRVELQDCLIENIGGTGTGFYVRHHEYRCPLLVDDVRFQRCRVRNITGAGFLITTVPGPTIRPQIRTRNVRLIDCVSDAPVTIACGVESVLLEGCQFSAATGIGCEGRNARPAERGPKWPVRSVTITGGTFGKLIINAQAGNPSGRLDDPAIPNYVPRIRLRRLQRDTPIEVSGKAAELVRD
ncbi:MAG: hypothetical protein CMJ59_15975 [Planctomycetaceae bacterium]|nr:hypothetical protein [Planctomycetaceae bacterium]